MFRTELRMFTCDLCKGNVEAYYLWIKKNNRLYRVPVRICTNPDCMSRQGAVSISTDHPSFVHGHRSATLSEPKAY